MKSFTKRRVEVSLFPLVVLLGIACGLMFCAFLLGYSTGNKVGFSEAREASLKRMAKFPIDEVIDEDMTRKERVDAYLKLENNSSLRKEKKNKKAEVKETKKDNILLNDLLVKKKGNDNPQEKKKDAEKTETIGSLIAKKKKKDSETSFQLVKEKESKKIAILKEVERDILVKKPPKVEEKKAVQSKYLAKKITPGWYAQVAAPTSIDEANDLANKLHSSGFRLVIERAEINGSTYFRVLVGSERNKTQALKLVEQLRREPYIDSTPFVRRMS